jgi:rod shape-determining protein MreD
MDSGMRGLFLLMTFGGSLAQWSVVPALSVGGVTPDLPLIVTVFLALRRGPEVGCLAGFVAGFLQDMAGGGLIGVQALTKALAGFGMGLLVGRLWVASPLVQVPGLVLLTVVEGLMRYSLLEFFHFPVSLGELMVRVILPQALYNGALGSACLLLMTVATAARRRMWT